MMVKPEPKEYHLISFERRNTYQVLLRAERYLLRREAEVKQRFLRDMARLPSDYFNMRVSRYIIASIIKYGVATYALDLMMKDGDAWTNRRGKVKAPLISPSSQ